jgi:hypothetical protein
MSRPIGVTLIGILSLLSGLWGVFKGLLWLGIGGVVSFGLSAAAHPVAGALVGILAVIFGVIALVTGVFALIFAFGAFGLKPWAWSWGVWTHAAIVIWNLLAALGPARLAERWVTLAVSGLILFYLTTPAIKRAFGKI